MKFRQASIAVLLLAGSALAAVPLSAQAPTNGWGVPLTDVTPDPAIRYGTLPNGLKYAIKRNAVPKGGGAFRLRFEFGSIGEADSERGLAHFIEHMAFNGTTNVAEGEMIKILERQGLKFGPDTNASTGFDQTIYMLDLPQTDAPRMDTALMLLREIASEVKFEQAAVDRERGVILGERRVRDTYQLRQITDQLEFQLPQTAYPDRLPIGTEEVLRTAPATRLKDLYRRYYRPENATLVFVGDADPAEVEARIRSKFADWKNDGPSGPPLPRGKVDQARQTAVDTFIDPAVATTVTLTTFRPWAEPADTLAERRNSIVRALAMAMFNRRLSKIVSAPDSLLLSGGASPNDVDDAALGMTLGLVARDGAWKEALGIGEQELRRASLHGFNQAELNQQKAEAIGAARSAADQADARSHQAIASVLLGTVGKPAFVTTPAFRLNYLVKIASGITIADVNAAFREMWSGSQPLVHVSARQELDAKVLTAALAESRAVAVTAPKADSAVAFAYNNFGPPGTIVEDRRITDLGIRTIRFANNVRLNIKRTDFERGKVLFSARLAGGSLAFPKDQPGLNTMLNSLATLGATGKHSLDEIRTIGAGHQLTAGWAVGTDAIIASGTTNARELNLQMKLSAAYLTDPGFRPEAASQWGNIVPLLDKQIDATPGGVMGARVPAILASGDWRFGVAPTAELAKRNMASAKLLVAPLSSSAPIEIGIVGDIDEDAAIRAVAQSFAALPARSANPSEVPEARVATFRADRSPILLTHSGGQDQALVGAAWPTDDDDDFRKEIGMALLGEVMDLMLTDSVREELGASYGVSVGSTMSDIFDGFGFMMVNSVVAPDKADEVDGVFTSVAKELRDKPIPADLLERARAPMLEASAKAMRQNRYWLGFVDDAQTKQDRLDRVRTRDALLRSVTAAEIQALARQYLTDASRQRVRIVSDKLQLAGQPSGKAASQP